MDLEGETPSERARAVEVVREPALEVWWPPPPHDPRERVEVARLDAWEVRAFRSDGVKHRYFARHGMLHLQLWHPQARVSVLTPSRLTLHRYEAFPIQDWKFAHASLRSIRGIVRSVHRVELPSEAQIRASEQWYVARALLDGEHAAARAPRA